jgi:hypothetical protein
MARALQFTFGRFMVATVIIGYFCAFPELAVLLGISLVSLLFVAPVLATSYCACRFSLRPGTGSIEPANSSADVGR